MILAAIVATDKNLGIGLNNGLPWPNHSEDMKRFKTITMGCPVIMGRKTYESLGRLLPGRMNVVITRDRDYVNNANFKTGLCVVHELEAALDLCRANEKVFIIGGAEIYQAARGFIDELYHTVIQGNFVNDTALPESFFADFIIDNEEDFGPDEKNPTALTFKKLLKKPNAAAERVGLKLRLLTFLLGDASTGLDEETKYQGLTVPYILNCALNPEIQKNWKPKTGDLVLHKSGHIGNITSTAKSPHDEIHYMIGAYTYQYIDGSTQKTGLFHYTFCESGHPPHIPLGAAVSDHDAALCMKRSEFMHVPYPSEVIGTKEQFEEEYNLQYTVPGIKADLRQIYNRYNGSHHILMLDAIEAYIKKLKSPTKE